MELAPGDHMLPEWNRDVIWSKRDARKRRHRSFAFTGIVVAAGIGLGLANHGCYELILLAEAPIEPVSFVVPTVFDDCAVDEDCVVTLVTCCGECEPTPPFEAAPRSALAVLRSECFPRERVCDPPACTPKPPDCEARAICKSGKCTVVANQQCLGRRARSSP